MESIVIGPKPSGMPATTHSVLYHSLSKRQETLPRLTNFTGRSRQSLAGHVPDEMQRMKMTQLILLKITYVIAPVRWPGQSRPPFGIFLQPRPARMLGGNWPCQLRRRPEITSSFRVCRIDTGQGNGHPAFFSRPGGRPHTNPTAPARGARGGTCWPPHSAPRWRVLMLRVSRRHQSRLVIETTRDLVPTVLRGNAVFDALRRLAVPTRGPTDLRMLSPMRTPCQSEDDAERRRRHSHAEHGNEEWAALRQYSDHSPVRGQRGANCATSKLARRVSMDTRPTARAMHTNPTCLRGDRLGIWRRPRPAPSGWRVGLVWVSATPGRGRGNDEVISGASLPWSHVLTEVRLGNRSLVRKWLAEVPRFDSTRTEPLRSISVINSPITVQMAAGAVGQAPRSGRWLGGTGAASCLALATPGRTPMPWPPARRRW